MAPKSATLTAPKATRDERRWLEQHADQLSPITLRATWIHAPGERPDRNGQTLATRSRDVIRHWAEERGAVPVTAGPEQRNQSNCFRLDSPDRERG
jgi:hypothetical protein